MISNMSGTGRFPAGNSSMALRHYITPVNIKKLSWLLGNGMLRILQVIYLFLTAATIIKCIILMVDCNPERFRCL